MSTTISIQLSPYIFQHIKERLESAFHGHLIKEKDGYRYIDMTGVALTTRAPGVDEDDEMYDKLGDEIERHPIVPSK